MTPPNLRDLLNQHFDKEGLRQLCLDLSIEYENLRGETRIEKAQALVEYCLRHGRLPELVNRCRVLRPSVEWPDIDAAAAEWQKVQQGITAQEGLSGILPAAQVEATLRLLRAKEADLLTQLVGGDLALGDKVGGDKVAGDKIIAGIVNIYREGGGEGAVSDGRLREAIDAYLRWVDKSYGRVRLRGLSDREHEIPDSNLPDIYVSLAAQGAAGRGRQGRGSIDMSTLLAQGNKLVITGAPGSGKTTFLRHIAHLLARAIYTGDKTAVRRQLSIKGDLPLPIYLSLGDYHRYKQDHKEGTLIDFISFTLTQQQGFYHLPPDFFARLLSRKNAICLLLDSLDEIPDENGRSQAINAIVQLADHDIGRMLVASRDHAYVGRVTLPARDFQRFIVQPMRSKQIAALVNRWSTAVYQPPQDDPAAEARKLQAEIADLEAIRKQQGEEPLIDTPLMVTIVAIVHYNERVLPQQRAALYEKCVTALLAEQHKEDEGQGQSRIALEKRGGGSLDAKRGWLARLAYEMMSRRTDKEAGRTADKTQIEAWLLPLFQQLEGDEAARRQLETFRVAMCDRASILHERGGLHEFTHLTFQEFLCAHHLAVSKSPAEVAAFFKAQNRVLHSWWREAILLTIGYLGKMETLQSLNLTGQMLSRFPDDAAGLAAAELAASGLLELEAPAPAARRKAHDRLAALLATPALTAEPALRALAGRTLSRLGDKRAGVGVVERNGVLIPDLRWGGEVPAGTYWIGDKNPKHSNEKRRKVSIEHSFRLSRYLITYAQFQCFINADDVGNSRWWDGMLPEAQEWREQELPFANHPREQISWYQATAFCRWLSDKLDKEITLPHEYQWEAAARWDGEKADGRVYPWGNKFDKTKANVKGIVGQTTAVGIFPAGKNEALELYDLSGNVWEWQRNKYDNPEDDQVDSSNHRRALRGGSWNYDRGNARAAYRGLDHPDYRIRNVGVRVAAGCVDPHLIGPLNTALGG